LSDNNINNNKIDLKRDSFSDRICDDLCQVLLSFLSFEDKIRFECVSKQWKTLIFNKQNAIQINDFLDLKENKRFVEFKENESFNKRIINRKNILNKLIQKSVNKTNKYEINLIAFESILKKCKFITDININFDRDFDYSLNEFNDDFVLQLITKYCNYLNKIEFTFNTISEQTLKLFGQKFGQRLKSINFLNEKSSFVNNYQLQSKLTFVKFVIVKISDLLVNFNSPTDFQSM
jgi:hypothetical protein